MSEYMQGSFDMFDFLTTVEYGKQCYFMQDNGMVYSRRSGKCMTLADAVEEFISDMGWRE